MAFLQQSLLQDFDSESIPLSQLLTDKISYFRGLRLKSRKVLGDIEGGRKRLHDANSCEGFRRANKIPRLRELRKRKSSNKNYCFTPFVECKNNEDIYREYCRTMTIEATKEWRDQLFIDSVVNVGIIVHEKRIHHRTLRRDKANELSKIEEEAIEKAKKRKINKEKMDRAFTQHKIFMLPCLEHLNQHRKIVSSNQLVQEFFFMVSQDLNKKKRQKALSFPRPQYFLQEPLLLGKRKRRQLRRLSNSEVAFESIKKFKDCEGCDEFPG